MDVMRKNQVEDVRGQSSTCICLQFPLCYANVMYLVSHGEIILLTGREGKWKPPRARGNCEPNVKDTGGMAN